jgi:hypothetical protein
LTVSDKISLAGLALTILLAVLAVIRAHGKKDLEFQGSTDRWQAGADEKIKRLLDDYETLHQWKNVMLPQSFERQSANILNVVDRMEKDINRRLERIEKHLNGALK